jgi:phage terminase large subunit-like protein
MCKDQLALCNYVEKCFGEEKIYVDKQQLKRYLNHQRYFPFQLLPWEKFIFTLHNCTYKAPGVLRWPVLFILVGRGAGKNGYLSFGSFCWITPVNGIQEYNVDIFATLADMGQKYSITLLGIDNFRYTLLTRALREAGFDTDKGGANKDDVALKQARSRDTIELSNSLLNQHLCCGVFRKQSNLILRFLMRFSQLCRR